MTVFRLINNKQRDTVAQVVGLAALPSYICNPVCADFGFSPSASRGFYEYSAFILQFKDMCCML